MPEHFNASAHYVKLLEYYESKNAEAKLIAVAKAEEEKKAAAAAAAAAAQRKAKAETLESKKRKREEKDYYRRLLAPNASPLSASAGVKIYSIFDEQCKCTEAWNWKPLSY